MVNDINAVQSIETASLRPARALDANHPEMGTTNLALGAGHDQLEVTREALEEAGKQASLVINAVSDTDLSFSIEDDLNRMVVIVRAVGSDEIVRQFPPEEFITVAKFIAAQDPTEIDDDFLKGLLFDERG